MSAEIFGRDAELRAITAFVSGVPSAPGALVIAGEAGMGKTTLLRAGAEAAASGLAVLRTMPAPGDMRLAFSGLGDLLQGYLPDLIDALNPPQARALQVALLLQEAPPYERQNRAPSYLWSLAARSMP